MCCNDHHGCIMNLSLDIIFIRSSNPPVARNQTISSNEFLPAFSSPVVTSKAQQARLFHLNGTFVHEPWPGQGHLVPAWSAYGMFIENIEIFLWPPRQSLDCKSPIFDGSLFLFLTETIRRNSEYIMLPSCPQLPSHAISDSVECVFE